MSVRSVALLICISLFAPQVHAQAKEQETKDKKPSDYVQDVADFASGVLEIYAKLVAKGNEVWDGLAKTQAAAVLDDVASAAGNQAKDNEILLSAMERSMKDKKTESLDILKRVTDLQSTLQQLAGKLDRFSVEVDKAAHPIGEQARVKFAVAFDARKAELDAIVISWKARRFDEAVGHMKKAQQYLDVMRKIITCLQDSVKAEKPACDPNQFVMPDGAMKVDVVIVGF